MKVLRQQLHLEQPGIEVAAGRIEERTDDRLEHLLAERRLGLLAPGHELGVEPELGLLALLPLQRRRTHEAKTGHRDGGQETAHGGQYDGHLVPMILVVRQPFQLRHGLRLA
jgi:hypothetical protein